VTFPRLTSRGSIEAFNSTPSARGAIGFPRLTSRGSIEAIEALARIWGCKWFPRLTSRGSIEANGRSRVQAAVAVSAAYEPRLH